MGRVKFTNAQPPGLRQNQRSSVRIVLDERDDVLKFERGSSIDETTPSSSSCATTAPCACRFSLGAASVSEIEVLQGLAAGDRVIASDMRDYDNVDQITIASPRWPTH